MDHQHSQESGVSHESLQVSSQSTNSSIEDTLHDLASVAKDLEDTPAAMPVRRKDRSTAPVGSCRTYFQRLDKDTCHLRARKLRMLRRSTVGVLQERQWILRIRAARARLGSAMEEDDSASVEEYDSLTRQYMFAMQQNREATADLRSLCRNEISDIKLVAACLQQLELDLTAPSGLPEDIDWSLIDQATREDIARS